MSIHFEFVTDIAAPVQTVFDLSLDIDAHLDSMATSGEKAIDGVTSGRIGLGEQVTWKARHFGIVWTMTSTITELEEPDRFVDQQLGGPFRAFRHEHRFEPHDGGTRMTDSIGFEAPFGPVGRVAESAVLGRYLPKLIAERNAFLKETAEMPDLGTPGG
jgi:ligand-binding SRPBCC domain-containing protein